MDREIIELSTEENVSSSCVTSTPPDSRETVSSTADEKRIIMETTSYEEERSSFLRTYSSFVVKHPFLLFTIILLLVILCACLSLIPSLGAPPLPDFAEPVKGFEARGTVISDRWRSQFNLVEHEIKGRITRVPEQCQENDGRPKEIQTKEPKAVCNDRLTFKQGKLTMKLVFKDKENGDLMTVSNLKSICRLEKRIVRSFDNFDVHCHKANDTQNCCPSWSISNYITVLQRRASCLDITRHDVKKMKGLLKKCAKYYHQGTLTENCWDFARNKASGKCSKVHEECTRYNAVYNILHYLTDKTFMSTASDTYLRYSLVLVPTNADQEFQVDIYKSRLIGDDVSDGDVVLTAFELSELKFAIFNERLLGDIYFAAIAMFFIVTILWFYTRSVLITSLVGLIVLSALVIAYFLYTVVLGMNFFPFLNILTLVFLVGIGADDAFVYMDVWSEKTQEHKARRGNTITTNDLINITTGTMKHASLSMFVTSLTTASAFFASLTSNITSIRLFGLYSGIAILCTLFLMVTWFPAAVIIDQTVLAHRCVCSSKPKLFFCKNASGENILDRLFKWHKTFFNNLLPDLIIKFRYVWVVFLLGLAVCGIILATVKPGLQLPSSQDFQMFHESHELEKYSLKLKKNFHFETSWKSSPFLINLIWGIKPIDNGDQFDPYDTGTLTWDKDFDVTTAQGQMWLFKLLRSIKKQPFFAKDQGQLNNTCFLEQFFRFMKANCTKDNKPCCKESTFPYPSSVFSECIRRMQCQNIKEYRNTGQSLTDGAPIFDENGTLKVISLKFASTVPFTWSYDPADTFWKQTENWATNEFVDAPDSADGWFISELQFYDLQKSLSKGTFLSMGISLAIAFAVMLLTTRNIFISVFAIITIVCALGVTVGSLVLMGWRLNILESITLSVAVGLSIDFALHYGVAYCLASDKTDRKTRVQISVSQMGSAITMAAFTTFITGAIVTPSRVLSYIQLGQFLMLIMFVSWLYATFFFQALCSIFGPENDTGQLTLSKLKAAYKQLKKCCCFMRNNSDHYQVMRKKDGGVIKKRARVVYIK